MPVPQKFNRILLKLSGEALMGERDHGIDPDMLGRVADDLISILKTGKRIAIVLGGGNIFRGVSGAAQGMDRAACDLMGMMATVINGIALQETLVRKGHDPALFCAYEIPGAVEQYERRAAQRALDAGRLVILTGGTGRPYFTTDTAAALRAAELGCDILAKASHVDGVYDKDPYKCDDAVRYNELSFTEALEKRLAVMDLAAFDLCMQNNIPILVFDLRPTGNLVKALSGDFSICSIVY